MGRALVDRPKLAIEPRDCRALWCAVLAVCWADAFPTADVVAYYRRDKSHARNWFGCADFFEVCALAGLDGRAVLGRFRARVALEAVQ